MQVGYIQVEITIWLPERSLLLNDGLHAADGFCDSFGPYCYGSNIMKTTRNDCKEKG
jgi:hypothetical protein